MSATGRSDRPRDRQHREHARTRELVTPEGVPLHLTLASAGDRAAAFLIDLLILYGSLMLLMWLTLQATGGSMAGSGWVMPLVLVFSFLLQNFYFIGFEMRWQGATPGKRLIGIRVIDRRGGSLSGDAIIARNLMRDLEVFVPAQLLFAPDLLFAGAPGWATLLAVLWLFVFVLLPLFNRDRLRVGDMVGGTLVVHTPRTLLLSDIGAQPRLAPAAPRYEFSDAQLAVYGVYELQVLEQVLRKDPASVEFFDAVATVADSIRRKIEWRGEGVEGERFLRDFYAALRARLERDLLFGKRKEDKHGGGRDL